VTMINCENGFAIYDFAKLNFQQNKIINSNKFSIKCFLNCSIFLSRILFSNSNLTLNTYSPLLIEKIFSNSSFGMKLSSIESNDFVSIVILQQTFFHISTQQLNSPPCCMKCHRFQRDWLHGDCWHFVYCLECYHGKKEKSLNKTGCVSIVRCSAVRS
jgi:hypothetical protein